MVQIEKMTRRDWLWPVIFLLLGAAGVFTAYKLFFRAFPEASIDLRLPREEVAARSLDFLRGHGLSTEGYHQSTVFDYDNRAKTYLERELGLEEANRAMSSTVRIWRWHTRLFNPPKTEEMNVWLTTAGELVGFNHRIDESAPGASLEKAAAQRIAEVFLRTEGKVDLARYKLVNDELTKRPARLDYQFTWEEQGFKLKDATRRVRVTITGDQVGGFQEFLKIPDQWVRDYDKLRDKNNLLEYIATALYVLLLVGGLIVIALSAQLKKVRWKAVLAIGGIVGLLYALNLWNGLSQALQQLPSNFPYGTSVMLLVVVFLITGILIALYTSMLAASGEPLYRQLLPDRLALNHLFTFHGLRTKEFFTSTLIGYGMAGMHLGLVTVFYTVAVRFGGWAPLDVNYDNTISTALPWVAPLATALMAATTEEFGFRLFAIPLLLRLTKSRVLAVIVPAFLWGFLHSSYPQQPAWFRGVEVGLIGIVAGVVFLRFGILATLVWHYTVDAVLMAMFLVRSDVLTYRISGALVGDAVLVPLLISVVFYVESRGFLRDTLSLNAAADLPSAPAAPDVVDQAAITAAVPAVKAIPQDKPFQFMPAEGMRLLAGAAVLAVVVAVWVKLSPVGSEIQIQVTPQAAEEAAVKYLHNMGVQVENYRRVTQITDGIPGSATDYLVERSSPAAVGELYRTVIPVVFYRTRFFIPGQKEEFDVFVRPDGKPERYVHTMDEKAPGARLNKAEAQTKAELFLRKRQIVLDHFRLVEHDLEERDARNDHVLTWEDQAPTLSDNARHRISVGVKGDEVTGPLHSVKVPEEWVRQHTQPNPFTVLPIVLIVGSALLGLVFTMRAVGKVNPHWRFHLGLGGIGAGLTLVNQMNGARAWALNYNTSIPWSSFTTQESLQVLMLTIGVLVGLAALGVVAEVLLAERFEGISFWPRRGPDRARALLEGLVAGVCAALVLNAARMLTSEAVEKIPSVVRNVPSGVPGFPVAEAPALALVLGGITAAFWGALLLAAAAAVFLRLLRTPLAAAIGMFLLFTLIPAAGAMSPVHFLKVWISSAVSLVVLAALLLLLRFNVVSYLALFLSTAVPAIIVDWSHPGLHPMAVQAATGFVLLVVAVVIWCRIELNRAS